MFIPEWWQKRIVVGSNGCWLWTGAKNNRNYGIIIDRQKDREIRRPAHVMVYRAIIGPVPDGFELDHLCRIHNCVNPQHLEPVTHQENCKRGDLGRTPWKLSDQEYAHVRRLSSEGARNADIARHFSVSPSYISMIINGVRRREVSE